jgi:hypothetical protein
VLVGENRMKYTKVMVSIVMILVLFNVVFGASTGPLSPTSATFDSAIGTKAWSGETNTFSSDNVYATVDVANGEISHYLIASGFDFSAIPLDNQIDGIEVMIELKLNQSGTGPQTKDYSVRLVKDGIISGTNKSKTATHASVDTQFSYGGSTDLWGLSFNHDDLNTLGVAFAGFKEGGNGGTKQIQVDAITVTVYHSPDTIDPVITVPTDISEEANAQGGAIVTFVVTATDNLDTNVDITCDFDSGDLFPLGATLVSCTATDDAGNEDTDFFTITVTDNTAPIITLTGDDPQVIEVGTAYVELGATADDIHDGDVSGDIDIDATAVDTNLVGSYTVFYDVEDTEGNPAITVTRTVNVVDTTAPVISLVGDAVIVVEVFDSYIDAGATAQDNYDGNITLSIITVNPVDVNVVANYTITYNVVDANSNNAVEVTRLVQVVDTTAPVVTVNTDISGVEATSTSGATVTFSTATALDNYDGVLVPVCNATSGDTFALGVTTVTCSVTDANANTGSDSFTIEVVDTTNPVLNIPANFVGVEATGTYGANISFVVSASDIADAAPAVLCNATSGASFGLGTTEVSCTATDASGNSDTQSFTIEVVDTTNPVLSIPANFVGVEATGAYGANVSFVVSASDIADAAPAVLCNATSGASFGLGTTEVSCTATDASGNSDTQSFTIEVVDTTNPVLSIPANFVGVEATGTYGANVSFVVSASDIADAAPAVLCNATSGASFGLGTTEVSCTATDASGNSDTQSFTIEVVDTTAPVLTLLGDAVVTLEVFDTYVDAGVDAADIFDGNITGLVVSVNPVNTSVVGNYTIYYDVTDSNTNAAVQITRTVQIVDTTAPVLTLLGDNPQVVELGDVYIELSAEAIDNYDGNISLNVTIDASVVNTSVLGLYTVTYTIVDANGNEAQENRTIEVVDTTAPAIVISAPLATTFTSSTVAVNFSATDLMLDSCWAELNGALNATSCGSYALTGLANGVYNLTVYANDSSNNTATQEVIFTVAVPAPTPAATTGGGGSIRRSSSASLPPSTQTTQEVVEEPAVEEVQTTPQPTDEQENTPNDAPANPTIAQNPLEANGTQAPGLGGFITGNTAPRVIAVIVGILVIAGLVYVFVARKN